MAIEYHLTVKKFTAAEGFANCLKSLIKTDFCKISFDQFYGSL